jgi:spore germination cell wall hydrolase CwlJ-like protein
MKLVSRAAVTAASLLCVASVATVSAPSFATETAVSGSATAMLAAVTAPLLAVDVQTLDARKTDFSSASGTPAGADVAAIPAATSLAALVDQNSGSETASEDDKCLATTVYYESKGEPLDGQLAVAQTILNRAASGRFADSVCGVVRQPGQFSFLHGSDMPSVPHNDSWARAVAIARIARDGLWKQIAPAALYFHARRVSPGWSKVKIAAVGNHVFFR